MARVNIDIELQQQIALCDWAKKIRLAVGITAFDMLISFKNESKEAGKPYQVARRIQRYKRAGLKPGTPDLIFAWPCHGWPGLFIEMKAPGKKPRDNQIERMDLLKKAGYLVVVADTTEKAIDYMKRYLNGTLVEKIDE